MIIPIVINWLKDEAYLLIESNDFLSDEEFLRVVTDMSSFKYRYGHFKSVRARTNARIWQSHLIYEAILSNHEIYIQRKGDFLPILTEEVDKEAFRITMADYYRLTKAF